MSTHIPGKLKFKGSKSSGKKKSKNKREIDEISDSNGRAKVSDTPAEESEIFLTEAQKKHEAKKLKMEAKLEKEAITATYRERFGGFPPFDLSLFLLTGLKHSITNYR